MSYPKDQWLWGHGIGKTIRRGVWRTLFLLSPNLKTNQIKLDIKISKFHCFEVCNCMKKTYTFYFCIPCHLVSITSSGAGYRSISHPRIPLLTHEKKPYHFLLDFCLKSYLRIILHVGWFKTSPTLVYISERTHCSKQVRLKDPFNYKFSVTHHFVGGSAHLNTFFFLLLWCGLSSTDFKLTLAMLKLTKLLLWARIFDA